jgi:hypothetical protein
VSREHARDDSKANARNRSGPEPAQANQLSGEALPPQAQLLLSLQPSAGNRAVSGVAQRLRKPDSAPRPNDTGLPDGLKSGIEALSGVSLDDVSVHYNSDRPGQLDALALTQGTEIHVSPGQERHLAHEAWHVVQQSQGRVQPTAQLEGGVPLNDDEALEHEADTMGARAAAAGAQPVQRRPLGALSGGLAPVQRILAHDRPISAGDVKEVKRVSKEKLVYVLTGKAGDLVVVKFESIGRASESRAQFADRSEALREVAAEVLQNVPGAIPLTPGDGAEIALLKDTLSADVAEFKDMTKNVLAAAQTYEQLFALKMQHIDVGKALSDLQRPSPTSSSSAPALAGGDGRKRIKARAGGPSLPAALISADSPVWKEFGRMAAFDILVSNNDRFRPRDKTQPVNLENLSRRGDEGVSLDVVDPNSPLPSADPWDGEDVFKNPDTWAKGIVEYICDTVPLIYHPMMLSEFIAGFKAGKTLLKSKQQTYRLLAIKVGAKHQISANVTYQALANRLAKV